MKKIFVLMSGMIIFCGCSEDNHKQLQYSNDIHPMDVFVNDFVHKDENGTRVTYRIRGRAKMVVKLKTVKPEEVKEKKIIKYSDVPLPCVDSVTFIPEMTKILDQDRSAFTSIKADEENHYKVRQEAVEQIRETANNDDVIRAAMYTTSVILDAFYRKQGYACEITWKE